MGRRPSVVLVLVLVADVLAGRWLLRGGGDDEVPAPTSPDERSGRVVDEGMTLRGAPASKAWAERQESGPAPWRLAGVVRSLEGGRIGPATAFLLVKEPELGHVAIVPRIRITAGRTQTVTVDLEPGFLEFVGRYVPEEGPTNSFGVRHPVCGELPACLHQEFSATLWQPGRVPSRAVWIGPYPGPEAKIVVEDEKGEKTTYPVRPEDD